MRYLLALLIFVSVGACGNGHDYHPYSREELMDFYMAGYNKGFASATRQARSMLKVEDHGNETWTIHTYNYDSSARIDSIVILEQMKH